MKSLKLKSIQNAYRKLKSFAYFDKNQSSLREMIVNFESENCENIEVGLKRMMTTINKLLNMVDGTPLPKDFDEINVRILPKKIAYNKEIIASNKPFSDIVEIEDYQAFFDAPIVIHILGVLWAMYVGEIIDDGFNDFIYGNRIKENLEGKSFSRGPSPYLMKPYFEQYQTWRSDAIDRLEYELANDNDVIMINMDLKRYFYQVNFNLEKLEIDYYQLLGDKNKFESKLTKVIHIICKKFTNRLKKYPQFENLNETVLPIGFYPSLILSNWYLKDFDRKIINSKTLYYGRYVDDILMIYPAKDFIRFHALIQKQRRNTENAGNEKETLLDNQIEMLNALYCRYRKKDDIWHKIDVEDNNKNDNQIHYPVIKGKENEIFAFDNEYIFNAKKLTLSYFHHDATTAMIDDFKKKIWQNRSEFKYVPEGIFEEDHSIILKNSGEREKVLKIKDIILDKYEFSKFLGKHLYIAKNIKGKPVTRTLKSLIKVLNKNNIIDNYLQWENLLTLFIMSETTLINNLLENIKESIEAISNSSEPSSLVRNAKESLLIHFKSSLKRVFSLVNNHYVKKILNDDHYKQYEKEISKSSYYRRFNMTNKNHLGMIPSLLKDCAKKPIKFFDINSIIMCLNLNVTLLESGTEGELKENKNYFLLPYNISLTDLQLLRLYRRIKECNFKMNDDKIPTNSIDIIRHYWLPINGYDQSNEQNLGVLNNRIIMNHSNFIRNNDKNNKNANTKNIISNQNIYLDCDFKHKKRIFEYLEDQVIEEAYVGVGNVRINNHSTYFDSIRNSTQDRSIERYTNLKETLNTAIRFNRISKKHTNLFVLPEAFVPLEWLHLLYSIAKKNDMAIISGLEHLKIGGKYYNFLISIFPVKINNFTMLNVNFHLKVHYSPLEEDEFGKTNLVSGELYEMHKWRGLNIVPYYCYELTSIYDRALFKKDGANIIVASVFNRDVEYFSNIIESLSRDIDSFIVQANDSLYGDSRIFQPAKKHYKNVMRVLGGINHTALISKLNIKSLQEHLKRPINIQTKNEKWKIGSIKE